MFYSLGSGEEEEGLSFSQIVEDFSEFEADPALRVLKGQTVLIGRLKQSDEDIDYKVMARALGAKYFHVDVGWSFEMNMKWMRYAASKDAPVICSHNFNLVENQNTIFSAEVEEFIKTGKYGKLPSGYGLYRF